VPQVRLAQTLDACRDKWLILTMNILEEQWPTAFDGRIVSRLESAGYMSLEGVPDYRQRKGRS
jgi:hypothetical protein